MFTHRHTQFFFENKKTHTHLCTLTRCCRPTKISPPKSYLQALLVIWSLPQPIHMSCHVMDLKLVLQTMLQVDTNQYEFFIGTQHEFVVMRILISLEWTTWIKLFYFLHLAYCTGLLLARRLLKLRDLDQEYEGNVEVDLSTSFQINLGEFCPI